MTGTTDGFVVSFLAREPDANAGLALVLHRIREANLIADRQEDIQIALTEAVNNIVEHAYVDRVPGHVIIRCALLPGRVEFEIRDTGIALPGGCPPGGAAPDVRVAKRQMPEGGFGWFLIRSLAQSIRYERQRDTNCLKIGFDLNRLTTADSQRAAKGPYSDQNPA